MEIKHAWVIFVIRLVSACVQLAEATNWHRQILQTSQGSNGSAPSTVHSPPPPPPSSAVGGPNSNATNEMTKEEEWSARQAAARLDLAGRQRMYSQKMTKDVLLIHLGTNVQTSLWQLEDTRAKFETVNTALYQGSEELMIPPATHPDLLAQLVVIPALWDPFHEVLKNIVNSGNVTLDEVLMVVSLEEALLSELNKLVEVVEKVNLLQGHVDSSEQNLQYSLDLSAMNQAGAQRMRSQQIMAKYAMCVAGLSFDKNLAELRMAVDQFELVHNGLLDGSSDLFLPPATDPRVVHWLDQVTLLWAGRKGFRAIVDMEPSMYRLPDLVAKSIPLLGRYNVVVGLMEKSSSAPPSPLAPPPFPSFPPTFIESDSIDEVVEISMYVGAVIGGIFGCVIIYHRCCRVHLGDNPERKTELHNPFTTNIKVFQDNDPEEK